MLHTIIFPIVTLKKGLDVQGLVKMKWLFKRKNEDNADRTFNCKHCNMKFEDQEKMKRHARKAHSEKGGDMPNFNPFGGT